MSVFINGFNLDGAQKLANIFKELSRTGTLLVKNGGGNSCYLTDEGYMFVKDIFSFLNIREIEQQSQLQISHLTSWQSTVDMWDKKFKMKTRMYFGQEISIYYKL